MCEAETAIIERFNRRQCHIGDAITDKIIADELFPARRDSYAEYSTRMMIHMVGNGEISLVHQESAEILNTTEAVEQLTSAKYQLRPKHLVITNVRDVVHGVRKRLRENGITFRVSSDSFLDESVPVTFEDADNSA